MTYTPAYQPIDIADPEVTKQFIRYSAGYAESLSERMDTLTENDRLWLAQFHDDPRIACDMLKRRHDLLLVTERLKE